MNVGKYLSVAWFLGFVVAADLGSSGKYLGYSLILAVFVSVWTYRKDLRAMWG